jgi:hypothetical protein
VRDWHAWHEEYDDPTSSLARRLEVVRHEVGRGLTWLETEGIGHPRLISMCAGDGRDVLPVLAGGHPTVAATLVELDPVLADRARSSADRLGLTEVDVRTADAGLSTSYQGSTPADLLTACGVFGNVTDDDVRRTLAAAPLMLQRGGTLIWTRGSRADVDRSALVRALLLEAGWEERAYVRPDDASYRVGVHTWQGLASGTVTDRIFSFV